MLFSNQVFINKDLIQKKVTIGQRITLIVVQQNKIYICELDRAEVGLTVQCQFTKTEYHCSKSISISVLFKPLSPASNVVPHR